MTYGELHHLTMAAAARLVRGKQVSPVELTLAVLERAQTLNHSLNAYITLTAESALDQARKAEDAVVRGEDTLGILHGVPVGLKDVFATRGVRTTGGSSILADWVPEDDCTVVRKLKSSGAVLVGKLNLHEFAYGVTNDNPHYGPTRNPWDLRRISGGSSGGSAVATATGMCLGSLGSDTGGSIRIPAALCGVVGLKPTYGRVSCHGVIALSQSLDHVGIITRSAQDAALMLRVVSGYDPNDPISIDVHVPDFTRGLKQGIHGMRVGVLAGDYFTPPDSQVADAYRTALDVLSSLGAELCDLNIPSLERAGAVNTTILDFEAAAWHNRWLEASSDGYGTEILNRLSKGRLLPEALYINAQSRRGRIRKATLKALQGVDVIALPSIPVPAPVIGAVKVKVGGHSWNVRSALTRYTQLFNLTGLPAISIPCGFTREGLPVGFQLAGRALDEKTLLRFAYAYEEATPWVGWRPPV